LLLKQLVVGFSEWHISTFGTPPSRDTVAFVIVNIVRPPCNTASPGIHLQALKTGILLLDYCRTHFGSLKPVRTRAGPFHDDPACACHADAYSANSLTSANGLADKRDHAPRCPTVSAVPPTHWRGTISKRRFVKSMTYSIHLCEVWEGATAPCPLA